MNKLDTYYDHYKDTYSHNRAAQSRRNKSFVFLCLLEAISFMLIRNSEFICGVINDVARKKLESVIIFSNTILQTLVWILIAYVLVRYIQDVLYIERQCGYMATLEKNIRDMLGEDEGNNIFSREGDHYLENYPMVLNFIDLFYKFFSPILFTAINIVHIFHEWKSGISIAPLIADTSICAAVFIITWFYFFEIHSKIAELFKRFPPIGWMAKTLRKWLKEV